MNEKELISQLNNLKNIKPDDTWKRESRDILLSQISAGDYSSEISERRFAVSYYLRNFFHQPVLVVSVILLAVLGGGIFSVGAARDTKPGDSLYIAKIISEKAQLAVTFNEKDKAKLGIEFAGNRAKEIARVLAEESGDDKEVKVEKLARSFKKEISAAKTRLKNIKVIKDDKKEKEGVESVQEENAAEQEDNTQVFSANLGKKDKGMQVYTADNGGSETSSSAAADDSADAAPENSVAGDSGNDVEQVLGEAEELFARKDYDGTLNKLEEVNNIIDHIDGAADGETQSESATTTEEVEVLGVSGEAGADSATTTGDNPLK